MAEQESDSSEDMEDEEFSDEDEGEIGELIRQEKNENGRPQQLDLTLAWLALVKSRRPKE